MTRRDWLLLFLAFEGAPDGLDPVRVQKGMFLFAQTTNVRAIERYEFVPYNYGPLSKDIYGDLDDLSVEGLIRKEQVSGSKYSRYLATDAGIEAGNGLAQQAVRENGDAARALYDIKQRVADLSFEDLLEQVYEEFPQYAVKSLFRRQTRR